MKIKRDGIIGNNGSILYVTRSFYGVNSSSGGSLMRKNQVNAMRELGCHVNVITIGAKSMSKDSLLCLPVYFEKPLLLLERIGIIDDYLIFWRWRALRYIKKALKSSYYDIVFTTSGDEISTFVLGRDIVKKGLAKELHMNFRDPTYGIIIHNKFWYILRRKSFRSSLDLANSMSASSSVVANRLESLYKKTVAFYPSGYLKSMGNIERGDKLKFECKLIYGGNAGPKQSIENFFNFIPSYIHTHIYSDVDEKHENIHVYKPLDREKYLRILSCDSYIGIVTLIEPYANLCIPSKIYDFIYTETPVIALISGGAGRIISDNKIGVVLTELSEESIGLAFEEIRNNYYQYVLNIRRIKDDFDSVKTLGKVGIL